MPTIVPKFELSQNEREVIVLVHVATIRIDTIEVLVDDCGSVLHFYAHPYGLTLNFAPNRFDTGSISNNSNSSNTNNNQGGDGEGDGGGDGIVSAKYDPSKQTITIPLLKGKPSGVTWPNLEFTARLIQAREIPKRWLHQVVEEESTTATATTNNNVNNGEEDEDDLQQQQQQQQDFSSSTGTTNFSSFGYGFGNLFHNIFKDYCRSGLSREMLSLPGDPELISYDERTSLRVERELDDFNPDRYDYNLQERDDDYLYPLVMEFVPFWKKKKKKQQGEQQGKNDNNNTTTTTTTTIDPKETIINIDSTTTDNLAKSLEETLAISSSSSTTSTTTTTTTTTTQIQNNSTPTAAASSSSDSPFTLDETLALSTIPYPLIPKSLLVLKNDKSGESSNNNFELQQRLWCGVLDLLVPFVYDHVTTMGEPTVESAWTITTLSSSLSWLDPPKTIREAVVSLTRRMVIYPYWRNVDFAIHVVWDHVITILESTGDSGGLHVIVKCFLQARNILEKSEFYYVGNKLFVDPYLYWIQHQENNGGVTTVRLASCLREELSRVALKDDLELDLATYERMVMGNDDEEEEEESDDSDASSYSSSTDDEESDSDSDSNADDEEEEESSDAKKKEEGEREIIQEGPVNLQVSSALLDSEFADNVQDNVFSILDGGEKVVEQEPEGPDRKPTFLIQEIDDR